MNRNLDNKILKIEKSILKNNKSSMKILSETHVIADYLQRLLIQLQSTQCPRCATLTDSINDF